MHRIGSLLPAALASGLFVALACGDSNPGDLPAGSTNTSSTTSTASAGGDPTGMGGMLSAGGMTGEGAAAGMGGMLAAGGMGGALVVGGMAGTGGQGGSMPPTIAPDFGIADVNPNSATSGQTISPRDYVGKVSAWYFGHST
jgi:hypothetical protein